MPRQNATGPATNKGYELWRQDDNCNQFLVGTYASRAEAEQRQRTLEAGGHKQLYWIRKACTDG